MVAAALLFLSFLPLLGLPPAHFLPRVFGAGRPASNHPPALRTHILQTTRDASGSFSRPRHFHLARIPGGTRQGALLPLLPVLLLATLLEKVVTVYSQETAELPFDRLVLAGIC